MATTSFTHADLEALWVLNGGSPATADTAAAIAQAESGGCLYAKAGPTDDRPAPVCTYRHTLTEDSYGLWQINRDAHPSYSAASLYTPAGNVTAAVAISGGGASFTAWSTYKDGSYRPFLRFDIPPQPGTGATGTTPAGALAPAGHRGYADLRNSLGRHLPTQLWRSRHTGQRTLSLLAHKGKVRR